MAISLRLLVIPVFCYGEPLVKHVETLAKHCETSWNTRTCAVVAVRCNDIGAQQGNISTRCGVSCDVGVYLLFFHISSSNPMLLCTLSSVFPLIRNISSSEMSASYWVTPNWFLLPTSTAHSVRKSATVSSTAPHSRQSIAPRAKLCVHFSLIVFVPHWNRKAASRPLQTHS